MSVISCRDCGGHVWTKAIACLACGCPVELGDSGEVATKPVSQVTEVRQPSPMPVAPGKSTGVDRRSQLLRRLLR
jgi:hypothetical protein